MHTAFNFSSEDAWNRVVQKVGGVLVSELLPPRSNLPKNADYFFRDFGVIAELKRIVSDQNENERLNREVSDLVSKWVRDGKLFVFGTQRINLRELPLECAHEVVSLLRKPVQRRLQQANQQIKSTRELLGVEDARGTLILVHDGNYLLRPENVPNLIARCFKGGVYSSIDSIIYTNSNLAATSQQDRLDYMFFLHFNRNPNIPLPAELVHRLRAAWGEELERAAGRELRQTRSNTIADALAFIDSLYYRPPSDPGEIM